MCAEKYLYYWYAKFCSSMLFTHDTGNAQSLNSARINSNANSSHFFMRDGTFKCIQLKSCCRYTYDSFFKSMHVICTSQPPLGLPIFGLSIKNLLIVVTNLIFCESLLWDLSTNIQWKLNMESRGITICSFKCSILIITLYVMSTEMMLTRL